MYAVVACVCMAVNSVALYVLEQHSMSSLTMALDKASDPPLYELPMVRDLKITGAATTPHAYLPRARNILHTIF